MDKAGGGEGENAQSSNANHLKTLNAKIRFWKKKSNTDYDVGIDNFFNLTIVNQIAIAYASPMHFFLFRYRPYHTLNRIF
jgi:hypothetical protein